MARTAAHWLIGAALVAALLPLPATDHTAAAVYIAALAIAAALAAAAVHLAVLPAPSPVRPRRAWDTARPLTRQSDPAAAGHARPRAPTHS